MAPRLTGHKASLAREAFGFVREANTRSIALRWRRRYTALMRQSSPQLIEQYLPKGFQAHVFERTFSIPRSRLEVWQLLNDPKTFTRGQLFPFRVEFVEKNGSPGGFIPSTQTVHHGPALNCAGLITEVRAPEYRDLQYYYGSYILTLRWIRPTRLEFFFDELSGGRTQVKLRVSCYVRHWMAAPWTALQALFWGQFGWNIRIVLAWRGLF